MPLSGKLLIDPIPTTTANINCRSLLSSSDWRALRRYALSLSPVCSICLDDSLLEVHETWVYEIVDRPFDFRYSTSGIQRLTGVIPLCKTCHMCIHFTKNTREDDTDMIIAHLMTINDWDYDTVLVHMKNALYRRDSLSLGYQWSVNISWAHEILGRPPSLF